MTSPREKVERLMALATDPAALPAEAKTAATQAWRIIQRDGLLSSVGGPSNLLQFAAAIAASRAEGIQEGRAQAERTTEILVAKAHREGYARGCRDTQNGFMWDFHNVCGSSGPGVRQRKSGPETPPEPKATSGVPRPPNDPPTDPGSPKARYHAGWDRIWGSKEDK